jgi:hypothetical protein
MWDCGIVGEIGNGSSYHLWMNNLLCQNHFYRTKTTRRTTMDFPHLEPIVRTGMFFNQEFSETT